MTRRRQLLVLLPALLAACTATRPEPPVRRWNGRVTLQMRTPSEQRAEAFGYRLSQREDEYTLTLLGPLSGVAARVTAGRGGAVLERANEPDVRAADSGELMRGIFGFSLPVEMMVSWLDGRPWKDAAFLRLPDGSFEQAGWGVLPQRPDERGLPSVVRLRRTGAPGEPSLNILLTVARPAA